MGFVVVEESGWFVVVNGTFDYARFVMVMRFMVIMGFVYVIVLMLVKREFLLVIEQIFQFMQQIIVRSDVQINEWLNDFFAVIVFLNLNRNERIDGDQP